MSLPGKAAGGPVSGGSPYIVGERGPELFVPSNSGAIVPTHRLADSMVGGQPQIVYNGPYIANMSAIDTQSSIQFLAKNKQAVWSANQSAQRSMPVSR
jgi:phage-related minor tail protein